MSATVMAVLNVRLGLSPGISVLGALGAATCLGAVNGAVVVGFNVNSFIATLGTGTLAAGFAAWISDSTVISGLSPDAVEWIYGKQLLGVSLAFYYGLAVCVLVGYLLDWTSVGRRFLIVGRNRSVARLSGIRVGRARYLAFVLGGFVAGIGGVVYAGTLGGADPAAGPSFLLPGFAAAFLSATTISPGRFNVWGSVLAAYFLVTGISGLQLLGEPGFVQDLFYGGALVVAVVLSQALRRRETMEMGISGG
jgi:ribose transport system permease protein